MFVFPNFVIAHCGKLFTIDRSIDRSIDQSKHVCVMLDIVDFFIKYKMFKPLMPD